MSAVKVEIFLRGIYPVVLLPKPPYDWSHIEQPMLLGPKRIINYLGMILFLARFRTSHGNLPTFSSVPGELVDLLRYLRGS